MKKVNKFQGWVTIDGVDKVKVMVTAFKLGDVCIWLSDNFGAACDIDGMSVTVTKGSKKALFTFEVVDAWDTEHQHVDCFTATLAAVPVVTVKWNTIAETAGGKVPKGDFAQMWSGKTNKWCRQWRINPSMNLVEECANLYTMYDTMINMPDSDCENMPISTIILYEDKVRKLEGQFTRYLDMIIGGELRHISHNIGHTVLDNYCKGKGKVHQQVVAAVRASQGIDTETSTKDKSDDEYAGSRAMMWVTWQEIRGEYGIEALYVARDLFRDHLWDRSYGGENWALICDCLIRHLDGKDTDIIFIDTVWSLQHNGGTALNKVWHIDPVLNKVLANKFAGNIPVVAKYSSEWVKKTWVERTGGKGTRATRLVE